MATASSETSPARERVSSEILDRQPPSNLEAERAILGSVVLLPDVLDEVIECVRPEDFYDEANQKIFNHMLEMHNEGRHVDITLLVELLRSEGDLEFVGGTAYLAEIVQAVPTAANACYYADIVREKATLRSLISASTEILRDAYDPSAVPREMLARAEEKVFWILENKGSVAVSQMNTILQDAMSRLDERMQADHTISGVETGFTDLDNLLGGLHNSELVILAARPGMGKTAFAMNIAANVTIKTNEPALFVSLEMGATELADRLLGSEARVEGHRMRNGTLSGEDRKKLVEKCGEISSAPLFVDDSPSRTVTEIAAAARRLKRKDGLSVIIVDYLQLIEPDNPKDPRQEQVAKIARRLKLMARELKVPVMCLAQLNRATEQGKGADGNRPRLSNLRESGAIEQDADVVMFIHREEYYKQNEEDRAAVHGEADIMVAKQRHGPIDDIKLTWIGKFTRFENAPQYSADGRLDSFNDPSAGADPF